MIIMIMGVLIARMVVVVTAELVTLDAAHKATLLDAHNAARCAVGVADLRWDAADEASATAWAANCVYEHSSSDARGGRGENIAAAMGTGFPAVLGGANRGWIDQERPNWPCETGEIPNCEPVPGAQNTQCGHYTQVVWGATSTMGCAHALCSENNPFGQNGEWRFTVCQFNPPGNMMGARPFPVEQCEGGSICGAPAPPPTTSTSEPASNTPEPAATQGAAAATAAAPDTDAALEDPDETSPVLAAVLVAAIIAGVVVVVRRRRGLDGPLSSAAKGGDGAADGDEDLEAWGENMFTELDADSSGGLDKQELLKACAQRGLVADAAFIDGLWDVLDKDGSGDLQLEEFKHALTVIARKNATDEARATVNPAAPQIRLPVAESLRESASRTAGPSDTRRAPPDLSAIQREREKERSSSRATSEANSAGSAPMTAPDSRVVTEPTRSPLSDLHREARAKQKLPAPSLVGIVPKERHTETPKRGPAPPLPPRRMHTPGGATRI